MHVQFYEGYLLQTLECYWPSFAIWSPILAYFLTPQPRHFIFTLVALGKKFGASRLFITDIYIRSYHFLSSSMFLPKHIHGGSLKQWTKNYCKSPRKWSILSHKFPFKWPVNSTMRTDPARNLETLHAPKKNTTIDCLSSAIFAALTFSVSLPSFSASSSARTCLVRAFRQGLQRNLAQLLVFCISY